MILGIECTAHTFGIALVEKGKVLVNIRDMYTTETGGIIPMKSAAHHKAIADELYARALVDAGVDEVKIEAIALSNAPGLAPCLIEGLRFAEKLSEKLNVPVVPVNHFQTSIHSTLKKNFYKQQHLLQQFFYFENQS